MVRVRTLTLGFLSFCCLLLLGPWAQAQPIYHEHRLQFPEETTQAHKIVLIEFFSYACHVCAHIEPELSNFRKKLPKDVVFKRIPVEFHPGWNLLAKLYYTALAVGKEPEISAALFQAIHDPKQEATPWDEARFRALFKAHGVPESDFDQAFGFGPSIQAHLALGQRIAFAYEIMSVPTVLVNGRKSLSTADVGGDPKRFVQELLKLIEEERKASASKR